MPKDFNVHEQARRDVQRVVRLERKSVSVPAAIEYLLWTAMGFSVLGMIASMYWVGPQEPIPGTVWLGYSLTLILTFGALAALLHLGRTHMADVDRTMTDRFERRR